MSSAEQLIPSQSQVEQILKVWNADVELVSIDSLTPDASGRTYYRLNHKKVPSSKVPESSILMKFGSLNPPEVGGEGEVVLTDAAVVMLTRFFRTNEVLVPVLYADARDSGFLLIEDLGDQLLGDALASDQFTAKHVDIMFRLALEQLDRIQSIRPVEDFFLFKRAFTKSVYLGELEEYSQYFLSQFNLTDEDKSLTNKFFQTLVSELEAAPQCLCHRDYHAWNLIFDKKGTVRVIDFQDALVGPRAYDLASLLNDRDVDKMLGRERKMMLLQSFAEQFKDSGRFYDEYDRALLQRDLKVVGRFEKFAQVQNMPQYKKWIPGTSSRIFATLKNIVEMGNANSVYGEFLKMLDSRIEDDELKSSS